jgi:hypothetical protein
MQKFILLLCLLPLISFAQRKPSSKKAAPLIESITSDTVKGKYKAFVFEYDQLKRVSSITEKENEIKKGPENKTSTVERIIKVQKFQYRQKEQIPFARQIDSYDDETGELIREYQKLEYFLFKDGKRIGDSTVYPLYEVKENAQVATFVQTPTEVTHELDLSEKDSTTYHPPNIYYNHFTIGNQKNIKDESSERIISFRFNPRAYFTFTKYDQAINPLHQLNIAPLLSNEKITLSFGSDEMQQIGKCIDGLGTEFNWHYLNQNNPLNLNFERGETESPFEDIIELSYSYNQDHQPTYCKTLVKKIFKKDDGRLAGTYKKSFTFRYKQ